ncbi:MAG: hypothetical protein ACTSVI_16210 [Promethearchaeota archaeon]
MNFKPLYNYLKKHPEIKDLKRITITKVNNKAEMEEYMKRGGKSFGIAIPKNGSNKKVILKPGKNEALYDKLIREGLEKELNRKDKQNEKDKGKENI